MDSGLTAYREALDALFARTGSTSKYGLDRTFTFLDALGDPHERIRTIHVAGTNGKGSVVAILYALLRAKGLSVGMYTSPHLIDFGERIVVDDEQIDEDYVATFLKRWESTADRIGATFFEITTAMAFHYFATRAVDVAVIETGLGGRLDATNVIHPVVSGITSISIDHAEYLGSTEHEIASEKAGIFKPDVPSVIGEMSTEARVAIYRTARNAGAASVIEASRLYRTSDVEVSARGTTFKVEHSGESRRLLSGMVGEAQARNTAVALAMLHAAGAEWAVTLDAAAEVLPSVRLAGRFQLLGRYIFDVAHNPDGMRLLAATLDSVSPPGPVVAVFGVLADKDWMQMMSLLAPHVDKLLLVAAPTAPRERAWNLDAALAYARAEDIDAEIAPNFEEAVRAEAGTVLVTGSFHTVGDALAILGETA